MRFINVEKSALLGVIVPSPRKAVGYPDPDNRRQIATVGFDC
jgi:hypothetical protein